MQRSLVELLDVYAKLNQLLGSKQTFFHKFYKGNYDSLDAFAIDREIKDIRDQIQATREEINEQVGEK